MTRKEAARSFLEMAGMGKVDDAYSRFIAPDFVHHNQYFKGDRDSLRSAMTGAHQQSPNKSVDVLRVFEDGDFVITHSRVTRSNASEPDIAVVHIFRFAGDQVVELHVSRPV